ncbi:hypothetical protein PVA17_20225 [Lysinibacillus sp. CNPSo 3705]|uniref:hypothetical protein n=1 Tax=Lysinibacillus sp. CNPSo 3705 TaxID=3028148 RepID=UPI0023635BC3|nr:hypothetical protein [Lysinibacillus sp. CNPSo 3705]MDD1505072.1 hypothetical protein [Lysinibacillus sp. CNPSo 3705]
MNKRKFSCTLLILVFIIICITLFFYFAYKGKEKEVLHENQKWVEKRVSDLEIDYKDNEKILNFIENSLPREVDSKNFPYFVRDNFNGEKLPEDDLQEMIFAELQYAIQEKNIDMLITTFDVNSYVEFVRQYENHEELVKAKNKLLSSIEKSGTFESISYIRKDKRLYTVVFNYATGNTIKVEVKLKRYTVDGTKNKYYYLIDSSFVDFFEAFNKSTEQ